jgi:hypothetical protein
MKNMAQTNLLGQRAGATMKKYFKLPVIPTEFFARAGMQPKHNDHLRVTS